MNKKFTNLIEIKTLIPDIKLDIKYATEDNFTKKKIYYSSNCYLIVCVIEALKSVYQEFNKRGYKIKIWDGYRPLQAQYLLWNYVSDERYVANSQKGSRHNRGCAVDLPY